MKTLTLLAVLLCATVARAEIKSDPLYCWTFVAGAPTTCTVKYELSTGRFRTACNNDRIYNTVAGDTFTKHCPGVPGYAQTCIAYLEVSPELEPGEGDLDVLFTESEGYGGCYYFPVP